jgi:hypothetical protein
MTDPTPRRISVEAILAMMVVLIGWIFSSGMLYERLHDIDAREQRLEEKLDQLQRWTNAMIVDGVRKE